MRIKLDENLPAGLTTVLAALGHDADTVPGEGLRGQDDRTVWRAAQDAGRLLITQDMDFSDVRRFRPGSHHGLVLVRLKKPGRRALTERVLTAFRSEDASTWERAFVVLTDSRTRVHRPE